MADKLERPVRRRRKGASLAETVYQMFATLWKKKFLILLLMLATAIAFSWYSVRKNEGMASATLTLRYEQAYEGLTPNGTRFNIYELTSDAVLEKTIERAGLAGELSKKDLLNSLAVRASGSQSAKNMYIATEYSVQLNGDKLPRRISAASMLRLLMETYKQYFLEHYGANDSALDIDWSDVENWEYLEFADIMDVKVNNLITYLNGLRTESGMSQYRISGESFRSLSESISNFRDIYLNKYTSYVTVNHLFRDPASYRSKLEYRRFQTEQNRESSEDAYEILQSALKKYDESMITFVMVPMYDSSNGLYMARTAIGMDKLTEDSKSYAEKIETSSKILKTFDRDIQSTRQADSDQKKRAVADQMISDIQEHLNSLISRIRLVKKDYEDYRSKNSIHYALSTPGLASGYNLKGAVVAAGAMFLLAVLSVAIQIHLKRE